MKLLLAAFAAAIAASASAIAGAVDTKPAPELKLKVALMASAPHNTAPFASPAAGPELRFAAPPAARPTQSRSSCNADRDLCYDANSGHIVYKPARRLMPGFPGLTPENISVRRDRVVFRYSF